MATKMKKIFLLLTLLISSRVFSQTVPTTTPPVAPVQLNTTTWYWEPSTKKHYAFNGSTYLWWQPTDSIQVARMIANASGSSVTAGNGLTKVGNSIKLGGGLIENTSINGVYDLLLGDVTGGNSSIIISPSGLSLNMRAHDPVSDHQGKLQLSPDFSIFGYQNKDNETNIRFTPSGAYMFDSNLSIGLLYFADYTANQLSNDRAITDVGGVKQLIGTYGGGYIPYTGATNDFVTTHGVTANSISTSPPTGQPNNYFTLQNNSITSGWGSSIRFGDTNSTFLASTQLSFTDKLGNIYLSLGNGSDGPSSYAPNLRVFKQASDPYDVVNKRALDSLNSKKADTSLYIKRTVGVIHLKTIPQLIAYSGLATDIFVEDQRTGGLFTYNSAVAVADSGLTQYATGKGVGLWQRKISQGDYINVGWYTYIKGDDIANDGPAIERLINVVGQTKLTFPDNDVYYGSVNIRTSNVNLLMGKNTVFDGQVFHVIGGGVVDSLAYNPIQNIQITGGIKLTGRFGTFYVKNLYVDKVEIVADSSIYAYQTFAGGSRGVHLYNGTQNSYIGQIITRSTKFNALSGALVTDCTQTTDAEQNKNNYIGSVIVLASKSNGLFSSKTKNNYIANLDIEAYGQGNFAQANGVGIVNDDGLHIGNVNVNGTKTPYTLNNGMFIAGTNNLTIDHAVSAHNPYKGIQIPEYGNGLRNKNLNIGTLIVTNNGSHGAQIFGEGQIGTLIAHTNDTLLTASTPNLVIQNSRSFIIENYLQPVKQTNINSAVIQASKNITIKNVNLNGSLSIAVSLVSDTLVNFGNFYAKNATEAIRMTTTRNVNIDNFKSDTLTTREIGNISVKALSIGYDPFIRWNTNPHADSAFSSKRNWYIDSTSLSVSGLQHYQGDYWFRKDGGVNTNAGWYATLNGTTFASISTADKLNTTNPRYTTVYAGTSITDAGLATAGIVTNTSAGLLGTVGVTGSGTVVESVSPALTGTPTVPTATPGTNNIQAASTAFVAAAVAAGGGSGANPTATVGLTAVNGSATTYMRSDAAPALSQSITPIWTGLHTHQFNSLGTTTTDAILLTNTTSAVSGTQQISPALDLVGQGFGTTGAASVPVSWRIVNQPVQGATATSILQFMSSINGATSTSPLTVNSAGLVTTTGGITTVGTGTFGAVTSSGSIQQQSTGLTTTVTPKVFTTNTTAATAGVPVQNSGTFRVNGTAYATGTSLSNSLGFDYYVNPTTGVTAGAIAKWDYFNTTLGTSVNTMTLDQSGNLTNTGLDNYSVDQSANYTLRSKVDKGYIASYLPTAAPVILATVTGINTKTTGSTALYTVPAGKTLMVTGAYVKCTAATAITAGPMADIGVAAASVYTNSNNSITTATQAYTYPVGGTMTPPTTGQVVNYNINTAATGTSQTVTVVLVGYLF